jgi:RNA polymerase sigma-70 factor, ECF subfamily
MRGERSEEVERVYREHRDRIWRSLLLYTGDRELAGDAVAEAFAQALRRGPAIRSVLPWVWRTSFHIAAAELKERSRFVEERDVATYEMPTEVTEVAEALGALSDRQRVATILVYYAGCSLAETARMLDSNVPAVGMLLVRARRRLRRVLEDPPDD